jgi:hypothetical protein
MKSKSHFFFLVVLACAGSLALIALRADDDEQGGNINGTESLDFQVMMTPTAAAPSGSSIKASLQADDEDGVTQAKLKLESQGLAAGTYSVSVTLKSDGSTVQLGTFTVTATPTPTPTATPTATPGNDDNGDNGGDDGDDNDNEGGDDNGGNGGTDCEFGNGTSLPFPANFNPFDIATIVVTDSNGVILFTADLTNVSTAQSMNFTANVQAQSGAGTSGATGTAVLSAATTKGSGTGSLQLSGHGLSANMPLTFAINGAPVKNVRSDKRGNLNVLIKAKGKSSSVAPGLNLFKVTSVGLHDRNGNLVLGASF